MTTTPATLTITRPDDWHAHLRDGAALHTVVPHTASQFARAIVMPNLKQPVTTTEQALAYKQRIVDATPAGARFTPLMTLYLTDNTTPKEVARAKEAGIVAFKLYPAGATTNSAAGVTDIRHCYPALQAMQRLGLLLLVHGEVTDPATDMFDREAAFIERVMQPLRQAMPELKIVFEHITTREAAQYVAQADAYTAATITPQHLLYNRNALFVGGIRPHFYCLPILKRETHRQALLQAAISGNPRIFLGTDSAPHAQSAKESCCGCAGCYSALTAMSHYAEAFEMMNALDKLEAFAGHYGADFYGLPRNTDTITLVREDWTPPESYPYLENDRLIPLGAKQTLKWQVK